MKRILFMPDTHSPYHDENAFKLFLRAGKKFEPHHLVILGDGGDCYKASDHDKDPARRLMFFEEMQIWNKMLDAVGNLGAKDVRYMEGNHEYWFTKLIMRNPQFYGLISMPKILKIDERRWQYFPYRQHSSIGKLRVVHDEGFCGKYAVHQTVSAMKANVAFGHTHRLGYVVDSTLLGESHVGVSFGWLGDYASATYAPVSRKLGWHHGFGVGYVCRDGTVFVQPVPIVDGKCVIEGKLIR